MNITFKYTHRGDAENAEVAPRILNQDTTVRNSVVRRQYSVCAGGECGDVDPQMVQVSLKEISVHGLIYVGKNVCAWKALTAP